MAGFSVGIPNDSDARIAGTIRLDDVSLLPKAPPASDGGLTPNPAVMEARRAVEANPTDARAHLKLALAYWDSGQQRQAYESLLKAAGLADPNDREFFLTAAKEFYQREAWVAAGTMYVRVIQTLPADEPTPPEIEEPFHESVYKAAEDSNMPLLLPFDRVAEQGRDRPMALVAQGRHALYQNETAQANDYLTQAKSLNPDMPELVLFEAEIRYKEGKMDEAKRLLNSLLADENISAWIRQLAKDYLFQYL
ncbi:MAG: tetratricopeptide repeat protein [Chloroflexota bacterium]